MDYSVLVKNKLLKLKNHPCPEFLALQIKFFRKESGLTQKELSETSRVKLRHLQRIESGSVDVKLSTLGAISRSLGVTPDKLLLPAKENINLMCEECRKNRKLLVGGLTR